MSAGEGAAVAQVGGAASSAGQPQGTALEARGLACVRGDRRLFAGISFILGPGEVLQVTGRNGSGKTSLLRILCGLALPEEGAVFWHGMSIRARGEEFLGQLFYLGHQNGIKDDLTGVENLRVATTLVGRAAAPDEACAALRRMGLGGCEDLLTKFLSQGQKRRVALARLLLSDAVLWVLDEPYTALDSGAVGVVQEALHAHLDRGGMVVLTTHQDVPVKRGMRRLHMG